MLNPHRNRRLTVSLLHMEYCVSLELTLVYAVNKHGLVDRLKLALGLSKRGPGTTFDYRVPSIVRSRKYESD